MSVEGSDPQSREGKKSESLGLPSDSHRNDVSPLTQGLRYRAACDYTATRRRVCKYTADKKLHIPWYWGNFNISITRSCHNSGWSCCAVLLLAATCTVIIYHSYCWVELRTRLSFIKLAFFFGLRICPYLFNFWTSDVLDMVISCRYSKKHNNFISMWNFSYTVSQ